jgi:hypothetical protein
MAPADHPARDAVCATLAWIARDEGSLLECYYSAPSTGGHYGGGHPSLTPLRQLRGGTFGGGRHMEQLLLVLQGFECEAVCLGPGIFDDLLADLHVPVRARDDDAGHLYTQLLARSVAEPQGWLVIGDGGRPQGISLAAYAYPEVFHRRLLAFPEGAELSPSDHPVEGVWLEHPPAGGVARLDQPEESSVAVQTAWMARRWCAQGSGFLLGDPELIGRWTPTAIRKGWLPIFAMPQREILRHLDLKDAKQSIVYGRQQDDSDFLALSRAGLAFQLVDPGRPVFPVLAEIHPRRAPAPRVESEPSDGQLKEWAREGRVLTSLLFWTGMMRELENLYALTEAIELSELAAGFVLTTASFEYMWAPPLSLQWVEQSLGGLQGKVETLLASGGEGAFLESEVPVERFRDTLKESVDRLGAWLGQENIPRGWWGVMDAPLVARNAPRLTFKPDRPYASLRYRGSGPDRPASTSASGPGERTAVRPFAKRLRHAVRRSAVGGFLEPLRPFDGFEPGPPGRALLTAVRDAGFGYALTKSGFGGRPKVVTGIDGLTVMNYTTGRWDGWTPFVTVNSLGDLQAAERRLVRQGRPGWLLGTLDTCLWAFSGTVLDRGRSLLEICSWTARGGSSRTLVNVLPGVIARYAAILAEMGAVDTLEAR